MNSQIERRKIVLYGDAKVGKTQLINTWLKVPFNADSNSTSLDLYNWPIHPGLEFQILELSRDEIFFSGHCSFCSIALLVFNTADENSYENLSDRLLKLRILTRNCEQIVLVANQIDVQPRKVSTVQGQNFATMANLKYFEVSAKTGEGLDSLKQYVLENAKKVMRPMSSSVKKLDLQCKVNLIRSAHRNTPAIVDVCAILRDGINDKNPNDYFHCKSSELKRKLKRLQFTYKSLLNTLLNCLFTFLLCLSVLGFLIAYCTGLLAANKKNSGHSFMFFKFGEKQQTKTLCNEIFAKTATQLVL